MINQYLLPISLIFSLETPVLRLYQELGITEYEKSSHQTYRKYKTKRIWICSEIRIHLRTICASTISFSISRIP